MKIITVLLLSYFVLLSPVTGAFWFPSLRHHHHHQQRVLIKFEEESHGNTRVTISEPEGNSGIDVVSDQQTHDLRNSKEHDQKEVTDKEAAGKAGEPKEKVSDQKLPESIKSVGEKATEAVGKVGSAVANALGKVSLGDKIQGTYKDSVVKIQDWDAIDSPKRIGEDIEQNASVKIEQGVEEVKETMGNVKEANINELLTRSKKAIFDVNSLMFALETVRSAISFCYLLGFSTAYGIGVWVTIFSSYVLGKCLPKQQFAMVLNQINMVYLRAMACCVGASLFGYLVTQGRKAGGFSNKMVMFQGFNLVSGFLMVLINLIFLVPRETKLAVEGMKERSRTESVAAEKLKKMKTYSSTLNASTMVMLTWHLAYIGQVLQARSH